MKKLEKNTKNSVKILPDFQITRTHIKDLSDNREL